jgi:hypothetical protein
MVTACLLGKSVFVRLRQDLNACIQGHCARNTLSLAKFSTFDLSHVALVLNFYGVQQWLDGVRTNSKDVVLFYQNTGI